MIAANYARERAAHAFVRLEPDRDRHGKEGRQSLVPNQA
jgi:hypothetical protein